jgi:hypothetical protein
LTLTLGAATAAAALFMGAGAASRPDDTASNTLTRLSAQLAARIVSEGAEAPVGLYVRGESADLARAFETLLAADLGSRKVPCVPVAATGPIDAERAARQMGMRSLVRLNVTLESGKVLVRGDVLGTWVNFWSGNAATRPASPAAALEGATDADAKALALATMPSAAPHKPPTELKLVGAAFARLPVPPAALAAGDVDGDGRAEVVVLTDEEVLVFSPLGRLLARRDHRVLPESPTPCREPFGTVAVLSKPTRIAYLSAKRARGELLTYDRGTLRAVGTFDEAPLARVGDAELTGALVPGQNVFAGPLTLGTAHWVLNAPFSTLSTHAAPGGNAFLVVAPDGSGSLSSGSPMAPASKLSGLGAGSALADVDGDGRPEICTSSPRHAPEVDELRISSLNGTAAGPELWRTAELPKGARILQIVPADLDGEGTEALIVGLWLPDGSGELDVFRRAPQ